MLVLPSGASSKKYCMEKIELTLENYIEVVGRENNFLSSLWFVMEKFD